MPIARSSILSFSILALALGVASPSDAVAPCADYADGLSITGRLPWMSGELVEVALDGDRAWIRDDQGDVLSVSIANPASPAHEGTLVPASPATALLRHGDHLLVATETGLELRDVSDPVALPLVGSVAIGDVPVDVAAAGDVAYVATEHGLALVDLSTPGSPVVVGTHPLTGDVTSVAFTDGFAYVSEIKAYEEYYTEIWKLDVSVPAIPVAVDSLRNPAWDAISFSFRVNSLIQAVPGRLEAVGDFTYFDFGQLVNINTTQVRGVDISGPMTWAASGIPETEHFVAATEGSVAVVGRHGHREALPGIGPYCSIDNFTFETYDLSSPPTAALTGKLAVPGLPRDVVADGGLAVVLCKEQGFVVIDMSSPAIVPPLSELPLVSYATTFGTDLLLGVHQLDMETPWGLEIRALYSVWDLTDPAGGAALLGDAEVLNLGYQGPVAVLSSGNRFWGYVAIGWGRIQVVNLSSITAPVWAGEVDGPGDLVRAVDPFLVGAEGPVFSVWDVSTPTMPALSSSIDLGGPAITDLARDGNGCWIANGTAELVRTDVSTSRASILDTYPVPTPVSYVTVEAGLVYALGTDGHLHVLDPALPPGGAVLGSAAWTPAGPPTGLAVRVGTAYVSAGDGGLDVLSVSDSAHPAHLGTRWVENAGGVLAFDEAIVAVHSCARPSSVLPLQCEATAVDARPTIVEAPFGLSVFPSPAGPGGTNVRFALERSGTVQLAVYDVAGRRVATLVDGPRDRGVHQVAWSPRAAGVYFVRLETSGGDVTKRVVRLR